MTRFRYIDWTEYGHLADRLVQQVRDGGVEFDLIIGVARGGIPVAMVISDQIGVGLDIINVKSYRGIAKRKRPTVVSTLTEKVRGKRLLVVDDLVDAGDTLRFVVGHLSSARPKSLKTAVLFKKPWSRFRPDFCLETVDEWVVFPWEHGEVGRALASQKKRKQALR